MSTRKLYGSIVSFISIFALFLIFSASGSFIGKADAADDPREIELPTLEFTEPTCEVPEINYVPPKVEGIIYVPLSGDMELGGTILIRAQTVEGKDSFILTDGWEYKDEVNKNDAVYHHTFDELGDCSEEVALPTPDITEATCEVPEVNALMPELEGV